MPGDLGKQRISGCKQVYLLAEAIEKLTQNELGTGIDMNEPFGYADLLADEPAQRR